MSLAATLRPPHATRSDPSQHACTSALAKHSPASTPAPFASESRFPRSPPSSSSTPAEHRNDQTFTTVPPRVCPADDVPLQDLPQAQFAGYQVGDEGGRADAGRPVISTGRRSRDPDGPVQGERPACRQTRNAQPSGGPARTPRPEPEPASCRTHPALVVDVAAARTTPTHCAFRPCPPLMRRSPVECVCPPPRCREEGTRASTNCRSGATRASSSRVPIPAPGE